jgi:hypothetical protein
MVENEQKRKTCPICKHYPVAVNYHRKGKTYFRTACTLRAYIKAKKSNPKLQIGLDRGIVKKINAIDARLNLNLTNNQMFIISMETPIILTGAI